LFSQNADDFFKEQKNLPEELQLVDEHDDDVSKSKRMRFGEGIYFV